MFPLCHIPRYQARRLTTYEVKKSSTNSVNHRRLELKGRKYDVFESNPTFSMGICRFNLTSPTQNRIQIRDESEWIRIRRRLANKFGIGLTENSNNRKQTSNRNVDFKSQNHHKENCQSKQDELCAICLERLPNHANDKRILDNNSAYFDQNDVKVLKCPHSFHRECIYRWRVLNYSCPVCRHVST
ncbi:uncharacterized protein LOC144427309 [Styela clava]